MNCKVVGTLDNGAQIEDCGDMVGGDIDVDTTVELMKRYSWADSTSNAILKIANEIKSKYSTDFEQIKAAYFFVVDTITYVPDGKNEVVVSPRHALTWRRKGDCDCMTTSVISILIALGFRNLYAKVIAWKPDTTGLNEFTHVYAMALIPSLDVVIPLDPVMEASGFGNEKQPVIRTKIYKIA
ncbi:MAG: transglutaminase-like domain-containing protein [Candidatus Kapaibacterium sp.]